MAVVSISVRTVQQGLTRVHQEDPTTPSPGTIDGVWGPRTQIALDTYRGLLVARPEVRYTDIPSGVVSIVIESMVAGALQLKAGEYRSPTQSGSSAVAANRVAAMGQETQTTLNYPSAPPYTALVAPTGHANSTWPLLLGLGAAVVLLGGGYWLYSRSKRRRR